jgi:hypothetical protein
MHAEAIKASTPQNTGLRGNPLLYRPPQSIGAVPYPILHQPVFSAGLVRDLSSVAVIDICGVDEVLEKHGPGFPH